MTDGADVWSQNAWDHVPPPDDQGEIIAAALAKQRSAPVPGDEKAKYKYYIKAVHPALATKLLSTYPLPMTLNDWIEHTCTLNAQWCFNRALKQHTFCPQNPCITLPSLSRAIKDPMAMDVDSLMVEQRQCYMKECCCFHCGKIGH